MNNNKIIKMSEKDVPNISEKNNLIGNMIIESNIMTTQEENKPENINNINLDLSQNNSTQTVNFISLKSKKHKSHHNKHKDDASSNSKLNLKSNLSSKNNIKGQKNKNIIEEKNDKKLSLKIKNNQSNSSFKNQQNDEKNSINVNLIVPKEENNEPTNKTESNEMNIENNENYGNHENTNNDNMIYYDKFNENKENEILNQPSLTWLTYDKSNYALIHMEYINEIWDSFIEKEKYNNYSFDGIVNIQTDIKASMRCILIDWLISLQDKFFTNIKTLFLTINLIDRYLSKFLILRTKFQLLGVTALFISMKYEEMYMKNINEFVNLTAQAFNKNEILDMENVLIDLVDFNLDLPLSIDFFGVLSLIYRFDKKEYKFGSFLLEAFLLDIESCKYKQSEIGLAACYVVLGLRFMKIINPNGDNNFLKYYSEIYKVNFEIWKNYDLIINCAELIYKFYLKSDEVKYREVYILFNDLFI